MLKQIGLVNILMIVMAVGLTGCASNTNGTTGVFPETGKLKQIHLNKSSKQEVENVLGKPKKIIVESDNTENWIYKTTNSDYTETYAAKKALSFAPVPYLGTVLGMVDTGPNQTGVTQTLSLLFNKKGVLKDMRRETEHF